MTDESTDTLFVKGWESLQHLEPEEIIFEGEAQSILPKDEAGVLFSTAWETLLEPSKKFVVEIQTQTVDSIPADHAVQRIAAAAGQKISAPVFTLKASAPKGIKKFRTINNTPDLTTRLGAALIDLAMWCSGVIIGFFVFHIPFSLPVVPLYFGMVILVGFLYSIGCYLFFSKTLGEKLCGFHAEAPQSMLIGRGALLPLSWLSPLLFTSFFMKKPLIDRILCISLKVSTP